MKKTNENKFRPFEIVHDFKFIPCSLPQDIKLPTPKERILRLKELGYGGLALNPSFNDYLSEESIKDTAELIKFANEQGLSVWIYDEKYYPSGSAGGTVVRKHPEHEAKAVAVETTDAASGELACINSPHGYSNALAAFVCELDKSGEPKFDTLADISDKRGFNGGILYNNKTENCVRIFAFFGKAAFEFCTTSYNTRGVRRYIDTLSRDAVTAFLDATYGGYKKYLDDIDELVEGAFTDEAQIPALCRDTYCEDFCQLVYSRQNDVFKVTDIPDSKVAFTPYIPWSDEIEAKFASQHGYELMSALPRLFFDMGEEGRRIRANFWETASDMFYHSFSENYREYCDEQKILYGGHFLYEEDFWMHPYTHGDLLKQLGIMHYPGCDLLFASPEQILNFATAPKVAASAAALYEREECLAEVSNIMRDIPVMSAATYKTATALEWALGITRFFSYYTEFCMSEDEMKECCEFCANIGKALDDTKPLRSCYVYIPNSTFRGQTYPTWGIDKRKDFSEDTKETEAFMKSVAQEIMRSGADFNFINDDILEKIASDNAPECFNCSEAVLILPPHTTVSENKAKNFSKVISASGLERLGELLRECGVNNIASPVSRNIIALHKCNDKKDAYLIVNIDGSDIDNITVNYSGNIKDKTITVYNPHTNTTANSDTLSVDIPSMECRIIFID